MSYYGNNYGGATGYYSNNNYGNTGGSTAIDVDLSGVDAWTGNNNAPVPAGDYHVWLERADMKVSAAGNQYLAVTYRICDGPYAKRCLFDNFSMWCEKRQPALQRFKALRAALGLNQNVGGTIEELIDKDFIAYVKTRESNRRNAEPGERENFVAAYKRIPVQTQSAPARPAASARPAQAAPQAAAPQAAQPAATPAQEQGTGHVEEAFPASEDGMPW